MIDFETFFAHTEPWIAAAAVPRYGDPRRDAELLVAALRDRDAAPG